MRSLWIVVAGVCAACSASAPLAPVAEPSAPSSGERAETFAMPSPATSEVRAQSNDAGVARLGMGQLPAVAWTFPEHPDWQQVAIGSNAVTWASYLNAVHNRIHGPFSTEYLQGVLDKAAANDPRNDPHLVVLLHVALDQRGAIAKLLVAKSSGVPAFDSEAASVFARSAPFGPPPSNLQSPDGVTYLSWALQRDGVFGCTTMNARPYAFAVGAGR